MAVVGRRDRGRCWWHGRGYGVPARMRLGVGGEKVVVHDVIQGGVVDLIVDSKMKDELVIGGDGLECERSEPCEGVWSLRAAVMSMYGSGAESLSSCAGDVTLAVVGGGDVWKVKYIVVGEGELKEWVRTCW